MAHQSLRVLVAEDVAANRRVITHILATRGHHVTVAANGRDALEAAGRGEFDAILLDLEMPVMNGYEATQAIRALERQAGRHTPIIALSAHAQEDQREACERVGMDAYITKPVDIHELIGVVESAVAQEKRREEGAGGWDGGHVVDEDSREVTLDLPATMRRLGGDRVLLQQFIEVFREDSPRLMETLAAAVSRRDASAALHAAHSLRGLASNFGADVVVNPASELEEASRREDLTGTEPLMTRLGRAVQQLIAALEPYRSPSGDATTH